MFIDPRRFQRAELSEEQSTFLVRLVSFARLIQNTTYDKCKMVRIDSPLGVCASLVMAHIIVRSNWGEHPVAVKESNLSLLEKSEYWRGKSFVYEHKEYRTYNSWLDYSIDLTDELTFFERQKYLPLLTATNLDAQIEVMSNLQDFPASYRSRIEELIERYGLWEFDA